MKLLFMKALDDKDRTYAIVLDNGDSLVGGVAMMTDWRHDYGLNLKSRFNFIWLWWQTVDSAEAFARERGWERPVEQIAYERASLEGPKT